MLHATGCSVLLLLVGLSLCIIKGLAIKGNGGVVV